MGRIPKHHFQTATERELEVHHRLCFDRIVEHATRRQPFIKTYSIFDSEVQYWSIGCPTEWTGKNGFAVFKRQFRRKPPTINHEITRISEGSRFSAINLKISLTREAKAKVIALVQAEMDRTGGDLGLMMEGLTKANCPSETTASMTEFQLEHFVRDNRIRPAQTKRI